MTLDARFQKCVKCGFESGDDWKQCEGVCPNKQSPFYAPSMAALAVSRKFKPGLYRHYKQKMYRALMLISDCETLELSVLYVALDYPNSPPQFRRYMPASGVDAWLDSVEHDVHGVKTVEPRFSYMGP